jgi:hypothetical protein
MKHLRYLVILLVLVSCKSEVNNNNVTDTGAVATDTSSTMSDTATSGTMATDTSATTSPTVMPGMPTDTTTTTGSIGPGTGPIIPGPTPPPPPTPKPPKKS